MKQAFAVLEEVAGIPAPLVRIGYAVALDAAYANEALLLLTGRPPKAPLGGVRMARHKMFFSPAKAIRELDLPETPPRQALADAADWFRQNGYTH